MRVKTDLKFEVDGIKVILEWIQENPLYPYYIDVDPSVPGPVIHGNSSVMLNLSYNNPCNVSVLAGHPCDGNLTIFNELFNYCE